MSILVPVDRMVGPVTEHGELGCLVGVIVVVFWQALCGVVVAGEKHSP